MELLICFTVAFCVIIVCDCVLFYKTEQYKRQNDVVVKVEYSDLQQIKARVRVLESSVETLFNAVTEKAWKESND